MKPEVYQFLIASFASLGSFLYGYDLGVIAEVVASKSFKSLFLQADAHSRSGTVVALFTGGCFVGALIAGFSDPLGRRGTILMASFIFTIGGIIQTAGVNIAMLYVGRLIAGIGVGLFTMIIPVYQAEISHRRIRGRITTLQQFFDGIGSIFAAWISYGCYVAYNPSGDSREWRIPLAIQIVPALFLGAFVYSVPESPRWLCNNDKWDQGLANLAKLHANGNIHDAYVTAEFNLIRSQIVEEHSTPKATYFDLFKDWPNIRRSILVMAAQGGCQLAGGSVIRYFSPQIFAQIGIATGETLLLTGVNVIIATFGTIACMILVEKVGRRWLQVTGAVLMAGTFAVNSALIKIFPPTSTSTAAHWTFIVMTWVFFFVLFSSAASLSWILPPEFFSTALRSKGVSLGAMTSFAFNTMISQVTPIAIASISWRFYLIFVITNISNAVFFWCFLPQTTGLNLEDMDELFYNSPTFVPGSHWKPSSHVDADAQLISEGKADLTVINHIETPGP